MNKLIFALGLVATLGFNTAVAAVANSSNAQVFEVLDKDKDKKKKKNKKDCSSEKKSCCEGSEKKSCEPKKEEQPK
jgi:hypothetical protein